MSATHTDSRKVGPTNGVQKSGRTRTGKNKSDGVEEAEIDGDEKDLREKGRRLAKDQNHGKGHGNNHGKGHGKDHGKNHGNHGKKDTKAGAADDYAIFGGFNRSFRSRFMQW